MVRQKTANLKTAVLTSVNGPIIMFYVKSNKSFCSIIFVAHAGDYGMIIGQKPLKVHEVHGIMIFHCYCKWPR